MDDVSELIQDYLNFEDSVEEGQGEDEATTVVRDEQNQNKTPNAGLAKSKNAITPLVQKEIMVGKVIIR